MEQVLDWLNENELRAFPLLEYSDKTLLANNQDSWSVPDNFLLDFQLVCFSHSLEQDKVLQSGQTVKISSPVYLKKITKTATYKAVIEVGTTSSTIASFELETYPGAGYPLYFRTNEGLVTLGQGLDTFLNVAQINQQFAGLLPVEPSTYSQFSDEWLGVNSIKTTPEKKTESYGYKPILPLEVVLENSLTSLTGDVTFIAGYNFRVNISNELIDLEISYGMGLRFDCSTPFLDPVYIDCEDIVSYINGVPPDSSGNFSIKAGANMSITKGTNLNNFDDAYDEKANDNTLFVGLTFGSSDICGPLNITPSLL
jgi:hypothetical protein